MTTSLIVLGSIVLMFIFYALRGKPGRAVADTALLVLVIGIVTVINLVFAQFTDTGDAARAVVIAFAGGFALDSVYGFMAPERQKQRDKKLRRLMKKRA